MGELILMLLGCIYSPAPFYVQFANIFLLKNNLKNIKIKKNKLKSGKVD